MIRNTISSTFNRDKIAVLESLSEDEKGGYGMKKQVTKVPVLVLSVLLLQLATISAVVVHARPDVQFQAIAKGTFWTTGYTGQGTWNRISWTSVGQGSKLILTGQGFGKGEINIFKSKISAAWTNGEHDFELNARLITDENTNLYAAAYGNLWRATIGYQQLNEDPWVEYGLRFEGTFKVDGNTFDLADSVNPWVGCIRIYDYKGGYPGDSVELSLYRGTNVWNRHTSMILRWGSILWGTEVVQTSVNLP